MERLSQCDMRAFPLSHRAVLTDCAVLFVAEVCEGRVVELPKRIEGIKCRGHDGTGDLLMRQAPIVNNAVDDAERQQIGGRELKRSAASFARSVSFHRIDAQASGLTTE